MKAQTAVRTGFAILIMSAVIPIIYGLNLYMEVALKKMLPEGHTKQVVVDRGVKVRTFADRLKAEGVISSSTHFTVAYISQYPSKTLQAGLYEITDQDTVLDLVEKVAKGLSLLEAVTLVEGWDWHQVQQSLRQGGRLTLHSEQSIQRYLEKKYPDHIWGSPLQSLEGVLMPDTFKFKRGVSDLVIIDYAFAQQQAFMKSVWAKRDPQTGYKSPYEALIVASLIERESRYPPEYPKIAAVILNRISKGIPIQIDASVMYGLGKHQQKLTYADLKRDTPHNTYLHKGLPPTPISMPGKKAIWAALHPFKFDALFYVLDAKGKRQHIFTNNFQAHLKAKGNNKKITQGEAVVSQE
jgi:UPF0755 protein